MARAARKVADDAQECRDRMMKLIAAVTVDGAPPMIDIGLAPLKSPQAQENGAAVTGVDAPREAWASEVGEGQSDGGAALGSAHALEDRQVLAGSATSQPPSSPALAAALEKLSGQSLRHSIITLYHETEEPVWKIGRYLAVSVENVEWFLKEARIHQDARVLRGDDARKTEFESDAD